MAMFAGFDVSLKTTSICVVEAPSRAAKTTPAI